MWWPFNLFFRKKKKSVVYTPSKIRHRAVSNAAPVVSTKVSNAAPSPVRHVSDMDAVVPAMAAIAMSSYPRESEPTSWESTKGDFSGGGSTEETRNTYAESSSSSFSSDSSSSFSSDSSSSFSSDSSS
jgi:hypothetical protein